MVLGTFSLNMAQVQARIGPWLSYMCRVRVTADVQGNSRGHISIRGGREPMKRLPGWHRHLCQCEDIHRSLNSGLVAQGCQRTAEIQTETRLWGRAGRSGAGEGYALPLSLSLHLRLARSVPRPPSLYLSLPLSLPLALSLRF